MERRRKERLITNLDVSITCDKQLLRTQALNISNIGVFISAPPQLCPTGAEINMAISFKQNTRTIVYLLPGRVIRSSPEGIALQYTASENMLKTLQQLASLQSGNCIAQVHTHRTRNHQHTS